MMSSVQLLLFKDIETLYSCLPSGAVQLAMINSRDDHGRLYSQMNCVQ